MLAPGCSGRDGGKVVEGNGTAHERSLSVICRVIFAPRPRSCPARNPSPSRQLTVDLRQRVQQGGDVVVGGERPRADPERAIGKCAEGPMDLRGVVQAAAD